MQPRWIRSEAGFVLPLVVGVGAVLMLLGTMMIIRASQNDRTAIASKSTSRSLAVAEAGLTQFQSLMNRYRALSTYTYCSNINNPVNAVDPKCSNSATAKTWSYVSDKDFCGTREKNGQLGEYYADLVKDYSDDFLNNTWQAGDGGQFRLVRYIYTPDPAAGSSTTVPRTLGAGELILEGRVDQESNGSASYRTSTTRLEVTFENRLEQVTDPNILPALWITDNQNSGTSNTVTFSPGSGFSIWDSTSPVNCDHTKVQELRNQLTSADDTYKLTSPELPFPSLPLMGNTLPPVGSTYSVPIIKNPATPLSISRQDVSGNQITYLTPPINLGNGQRLEIRQPIPTIPNLQTVALYINGDLNVQEGGQIVVENGIQLIIYAYGSVALNSNNSTKAIESNSITKLFGYTTDPISIKGDNEINLFVLAPRAPVTFDDRARVKGAVWASSWVGGADTALLREFPPNFLNQLPVNVPRIKPVRSWRRCMVADAPDYCKS